MGLIRKFRRGLGGASGLGGWGHWNPKQPRDMMGRFSSTGRTAGSSVPERKVRGPAAPGGGGGTRFGVGRIGVRVGTRSATVSASKSASLGKIRVVGGVYGRVERTQLTQVEIRARERAERAALRAAARIPNASASGIATQLVESRGQANIHGVGINLRSGSSTVRKTFTGGKTTTAGTRAPRRKPRTRSLSGTRVR